jgi:hypothetical protein
MTPHQKAIDAAARAMACADEDDFTDADWEAGGNIKDMYVEEAKIAWEAGLASARESGWELRPREATAEMASSWALSVRASGYGLWPRMFDAAPRFEDAP